MKKIPGRPIPVPTVCLLFCFKSWRKRNNVGVAMHSCCSNSFYPHKQVPPLISSVSPKRSFFYKSMSFIGLVSLWSLENIQKLRTTWRNEVASHLNGLPPPQPRVISSVLHPVFQLNRGLSVMHGGYRNSGATREECMGVSMKSLRQRQK